jgi:hypothetical protein
MTEVTALKCPKCGDIIFNRAHHDFHSCSCGAISVDGGFEYFRCLFAEDIDPPESFKLKIKPTRKQLYDDWNLRKDVYGTMKDAYNIIKD